MEDVVKNRVIMILLILVVILFLLWIGSSSAVSRQRSLVVSKAALSMELEEKNAKLEKEKSALVGELKDVKSQLEEEIANLEITKKTLSQEQVAEQALKVELEKITRLKETLETDLKEALADNNKKR